MCLFKSLWIIVKKMTTTELNVTEMFNNITYVSSCMGNVKNDSAAAFYDTAQFITGLIIYPVLCFPGIVGNILSLIVLFHRNMATSTNVYLAALAISDTLKLINDALYFVVIILKRTNEDPEGMVMAYLYPYAHYVFNVAVCVTAWLTVSIAVERYISVCHPTKAVSVCTIPRARNVSITVFVVMIIITIPSWFRYQAKQVFDTQLNITCYIPEPTELGHNQAFMRPYTWIQNLFRSIVPLVVLIILNAKIINELRRERIKGKSLSGRNRITLIMIIIIIVFLVCITPDAIMSMFFGFGYVEEDDIVKGIREITDSLLAANSAFNFVLYCTMSQHFRETFCLIFGCRPQGYPSRRPERDRLIKNGKAINGKAISAKINHTVQNGTETVLQETFV